MARTRGIGPRKRKAMDSHETNADRGTTHQESTSGVANRAISEPCESSTSQSKKMKIEFPAQKENSCPLTSSQSSDEGNGGRFMSGRDPPGQQCRYLMPGEPSRESYRLYTFICFPKESPVDIRNLAASGFHHTGYRDQAKCFSCGKCVQGWTANDNPSSPEFHEPDCDMVRGGDARNVESDSSSLRSLLNQCKQQTLQGTRVNISASNLHNLGINHQSLRHSPVHITSTANVTSTAANTTIRRRVLRLANVIDPEHQALLATLDLKKEEDRRKTFGKWPTYPAPYLLSELARRGFFYLGNLDRVQCFSCSLVLRNWAVDDDVTEQHQRHSSGCSMAHGNEPANVPMDEEIRQRLDEEYRRHLDTILSNSSTSDPPNPSPAEQRHLEVYLPCANPVNPHMVSLQSRIDSFRRWPGQKTRATPEQIAKSGFFYLGESDKTKCFYCNGGLQNWDYNDNPWIEHAKWFPGCEFVLRMKGVELVKKLSQDHPNLNRPLIRNPISWHVIPPFTLSESEQNSNEETEPMDAASSSMTARMDPVMEIHRPDLVKLQGASNIVEHSSENNSSLLSDFQQMQKSLFCSSCGQEKTEAVLMPCAHLCCCQKCADKVKHCPICNSKVRDHIKVFRA